MNVQTQDASNRDTAATSANGAKIIPPVRTSASQFSREVEIITRLDAEIVSLKQNVQFQQELLLKQQDAFTRQQDLMEKQLAAAHTQTYAQTPPAQSAVPDAGLSRVVNHPVGSNFLANGLLSLTALGLAAIGGYFKHSQDAVTSVLLFVSAVLSISATAYSVYSAISKKKMSLRTDRLGNLAMGAACLGFLATLTRVFWHAFISVPHARQFFWIMFVVEIAIILATNIAFSTLGFALQPVSNRLKNKAPGKP